MRTLRRVPFTDAYVRNIDSKNRLQIPAQMRGVINPELDGKSMFLVPGGRDNTLSLYTEAYFCEKAASLRTDERDDPDAIDFEQMFFGSASRIELDSQGRLVLPERQLAMVDLGTEVYVVGAQYRIDLWRKSGYEAFMQDVASRRSALHRVLRSPGRAAPSSGDVGSSGSREL